jgi:hypothetical protein
MFAESLRKNGYDFRFELFGGAERHGIERVGGKECIICIFEEVTMFFCPII